MTTIQRPMFPPAIDSTFLSAFRSCPRKAFLTYVEHWKPQNESVHLVAGAAFAAGVEASRRAFYVDGVGAEDACGLGLQALMHSYGDFECPADSAKSLERMCGALEFYFDRYPLGNDGATPILVGEKRGIEFSFAQPLDIRHPETGDPILYTGRADAICTFNDGIFVFDEKTASQLGASWSRQWDMRSQFTGYIWAARETGIDVQGAVVRGVSILKTKYDTLEAITYRAPWEIDRWLEQVYRDIARMLQCWEQGYWDYSLDHACTEYGGCSLQIVCKSPEPEKWLPMYFERRVWDPLAREEVSVEDWERAWRGSPI